MCAIKHSNRVATNLENFQGILRDFSEHGILREFCATSGKNLTNKIVLV